MKYLKLVFILLVIFFISSCSSSEVVLSCGSGHLLKEGACCKDNNRNRICDSKERVNKGTILPIFLSGDEENNSREELQPLGPYLLEVHFINLGDGDSTLVILPNRKTILIDGGDFSDGNKTIAYLNSVGVDKIDLLVATHPERENIGGLDNVLYFMDVRRVYDNGQYRSSKFYEDYYEAGRQNYRQKADHDFSAILDRNVEVNLIIPYTRSKYHDGYNDNSIILKVEYKNSSFLFPGDCEEACEDVVLEKADLKADVLRVAQHGAKESTNMAFLGEVDPDIAVISVSEFNLDGLPDFLTLERLRGINLYKTSTNGTIIIKTDGQQYIVKTEK